MRITATVVSTSFVTLLWPTQLAQLESLKLQQDLGNTYYNVKLKVVTDSQSIYINNWAVATKRDFQLTDSNDWLEMEVLDLEKIQILWSEASVDVTVFIS